MPSSHLILFCPLLLRPPIPLRIRVFSNESWGGQSIGVSTLASVLPMNTQDYSPLEWTGWISLQSKGLSGTLQHNSSKASILQLSAFFTVQLSHLYMTTGKIIRHILIKLTIIKHKEPIIKAAREKQQITQGDPNKDNSWSFNRNSSGQKGMAGHT